MSIDNFLKQRAVNLVSSGHYTLSNWYDPKGRLRKFPCRSTRVSPFRMIVEAPVVGKVGENLTSFFRDFGRLEGRISDAADHAFLLEIHADEVMRERMAKKLVWLEQKQRDSKLSERRGAQRIVPEDPCSAVTLADGTSHDCLVVDMSVTGVAVKTRILPKIGTPLAVGACIGRVVRHLSGGFAVRFIAPQSQRDLDQLIVRRNFWPSAIAAVSTS